MDNNNNNLTGVLGKLQDVTSSVKEKADDAGLTDKLGDVADAVRDTIEEADVQNKVFNAADTVKSKVEQSGIKLKLNETVDAVKGSDFVMKLPKMNVPEQGEQDGQDEKKKGVKELPRKEVKVLSTKSALKIFYYLITVNGEITSEEEERFDSIGKELDPSYKDNKKNLIDECRKQMDNIIDPDDNYDVIEEGVSKAISNTVVTSDSFITPKILVWDLLTLAYSDNNYDEIERRLVKSVVRQLNVNKSEFLELESSYLTMRDIEREIEWFKTTDRPYKEIEANVNELEDRKSVVMESVKDLITL